MICRCLVLLQLHRQVVIVLAVFDEVHRAEKSVIIHRQSFDYIRDVALIERLSIIS